MRKIGRIGTVLLLTVSAVAVAEVPLDKLEPPAEGKAAVYLFMPGKTPLIPTISIFDNEVQQPNLLGAREYVRYEVDPGLHTFVVQPMIPGLPSFDQFVHGDLEAGGIYAALVSGYLADLVVVPLTGRMDPELLINMKREPKQWERVAGLLDAKPPKPPGKKERDHTMTQAVVSGFEALHPTSAWDELVRLNREQPLPAELSLDLLPDPVEGRSVVTLFFPERKPDLSVTLFDGDRQLGPDLTGGGIYTYEVAPGRRQLWVREVGVDFTRQREVTGDLEPGKVYGLVVWHSLGNGGARLLTLSGDPAARPAFIREPELWEAVEALRDAPRAALETGDAVGATEMKNIEKKLKKKSKKKRRSTFVALR